MIREDLLKALDAGVVTAINRAQTRLKESNTVETPEYKAAYYTASFVASDLADTLISIRDALPPI